MPFLAAMTRTRHNTIFPSRDYSMIGKKSLIKSNKNRHNLSFWLRKFQLDVFFIVLNKN